MVASVIFGVLALQQPKPVIAPDEFTRVYDKVTKIGQKTKLEPALAKFFYLEGAEAVGHSKFDSERQILAVTIREKKFLVFVVPEKPFPEFGKTWAYRVNSGGTVDKGGVCEPRESYRAVSEADANKGAKAEADYWRKEILSGS